MFCLGRPPLCGIIQARDSRNRLRGTSTTVRSSKDTRDVQRLLQKFQEGGEGAKDFSKVADDSIVQPQESKDDDNDTNTTRQLNKYGLEFFDEGDFAEMNDKPIRTARPIERKHVAKFSEVEDQLAKEVDNLFEDFVGDLKASGEFTEEDVEDFRREFQAEADTKAVKKVLQEMGDMKGEIPDPNAPRPENMSQIESLMYDWYIPNFIHFEAGEGGLPVACLAHPNGERLRIHLQGACITSWKRFDGREAFLVRPDATFKEGEKINSGLTLAFPQYDNGGLPFDGFAGNLMWDVVHTEVTGPLSEDPAPSITLRCSDTEYTREMWPHKFEMFYKITLHQIDDPPSNAITPEEKAELLREELEDMGEDLPDHLVPEPEVIVPQPRVTRSKRWKRKKKLIDIYDVYDQQPPGTPSQITMQFTVKNLGDGPMEFLCATKPHFRVSDLRVYPEFVSTLGLGGKPFLDYNITSGRPRLRKQTKDYTLFEVTGAGTHAVFMDCQYGDVMFCPGTMVHYKLINRTGFPDLVAIQPGDQTPELFRWSRFVLVFGRAHLTTPIRIEPDEEWYGETVLRFHDRIYNEPIFGYQGRAPPANFPKRPNGDD